MPKRKKIVRHTEMPRMLTSANKKFETLCHDCPKECLQYTNKKENQSAKHSSEEYNKDQVYMCIVALQNIMHN